MTLAAQGNVLQALVPARGMDQGVALPVLTCLSDDPRWTFKRAGYAATQKAFFVFLVLLSLFEIII